MSETPPAEEPVLDGVTLGEKDAFRRKLFGIVDHIRRVNENAEKMASRIIESEECSHEDLDFARRLIQKVRSHDQSKFAGIEFQALAKDAGEELFKIALEQHQQTNDHHPEYWGDIREMPDLAICEMVLDWSARSQEMGTDLRSYIKNNAVERFSFTTKTKVYRRIKHFVDLLLEEPFT